MAFDHTAAQLALRARLLTLQVATTGSLSLSATAGGYTRASGSFLADGFVAGMEVTASGFGTAGNNGAHLVTAVSALAMEVRPALTAEGASAGRVLTAGVPAKRIYENIDAQPVQGLWYLEEQYDMQPPQLRSLPYNGGDAEQTGLYTVRVYGPTDVGPSALSKWADAALALFKPGTIITTPAGQVIRVRGDSGPYRGAIRPDTPGWAVCTITIPWRARYTN